MKTTYHVKINWHGEVHEFWTKAHSTAHALELAIWRLATKLKHTRWSVRNSVKHWEITST